MENMLFYDCNCAVGAKNAPSPWSPHMPKDILREMSLAGIKRAWAYCNLCLDYHPLVGNEEMLNIAETYPAFSPVFVVMPNHTREFLDPEELVLKMKRENVRMARACPRYNSNTFSLEDWCSGELLSALGDAGIPLLLDIDQSDWESVRKLCLSHPNLNVIVTNVYYRNLRYAVPLLKQLPNLFMDTSGLKVCNGLDEMANLVGVEKLLFGSDLGELSAGSAVCIVTYSALSDEDKRLVASGNLMRLLEMEAAV